MRETNVNAQWLAELATVSKAANAQVKAWAQAGHPVERTLLIALACAQIARSVLKARDGKEGEALGDELVRFALEKTMAAAVPEGQGGTVTFMDAPAKGGES